MSSHKLLFVSLTSQCQLHCDYCPVAQYRDPGKYPGNLPLKDLKIFIERHRPDSVELTGGEPTLYKGYSKLCDFLEEKNIPYITKSNGLLKGRNQVSAWHGSLKKFPKHFDKILIIKNTFEWEEKQEYCASRNIPFETIGFGSDRYNRRVGIDAVCQMFVCPDGHVKRCHEYEIPEERKTIFDDVAWLEGCRLCKAAADHFHFLDKEKLIKTKKERVEKMFISGNKFSKDNFLANTEKREAEEEVDAGIAQWGI